MVIISLPQAGDNNQSITDLVFTYAPEHAMLCSQRYPAVILSASAEALSEAKGKDLFIRRTRPFAEFPLSEAHGLRACP